ncbi:hypothetical protein FKM82_017855 [Ascaphus truei]
MPGVHSAKLLQNRAKTSANELYQIYVTKNSDYFNWILFFFYKYGDVFAVGLLQLCSRKPPEKYHTMGQLSKSSPSCKSRVCYFIQ